ncbi:hypothetical protein Misp01_36420 [Microtetraspora sp. NBRC 13810]|uniref:hypothetical protein n=1 Tax=Microtetraspora sp. NBRC 13810 TaxID=3030990 RepID=UPI00249FAEC3|nr:hypothetical protein [Microtetraspora sp. NBRC 13810]GLW08512.1 hypothetical protein Misp01_36420 [Microtetraspora sp. NBRC 13810]
MSGEGYRTLLECRRRSGILREQGLSFDQIAAVFALDHPVSPLRLYRFAHGRTAGDVVDAYNAADMAALRRARLYDYEAWPEAGRRPPARAVGVFARIYRTAARNLVSSEVYASYRPPDRAIIDRVDHRRTDPHQTLTGEPGAAPRRGEEMSADRASQVCADLLSAVDAVAAGMRHGETLLELAQMLGTAPGRGQLAPGRDGKEGRDLDQVLCALAAIPPVPRGGRRESRR